MLGSVAGHHAGKASGANTTVREIGGALGIAVLSTVFAAHGDTRGQQEFVDGLHPAVWVGAVVIAVAAVAAVFIGKGETRYHTHEPAPARTPELALADSALLPRDPGCVPPGSRPSGSAESHRPPDGGTDTNGHDPNP